MTLDPNWFYSSLSQCAAALVGLLGAILAVRIQQQHEATRLSYQLVVSRLDDLKALAQTRMDEIRSYLSFVEARIREIENALKEGEQRLSVGPDKLILGGDGEGQRPIDINESVVEGHMQGRQLARGMFDLLAPYEKSQTAKSGLGLAASIPKFRDMLSNIITLPQFKEKLSEEWIMQFAKYFEGAVVELNRVNSIHLGTASIRVPAILTGILGWLSVVGVLWPLAYLSAHDVMSKTYLLLAFGLGVVAIPSFIGWEIGRIRLMKDVKLPRRERSVT